MADANKVLRTKARMRAMVAGILGTSECFNDSHRVNLCSRDRVTDKLHKISSRKIAHGT